MSLLGIYRLTRSFGGLMAVNNVSFDVEAGTVVGLIGPNGAGKTTIFNLITGVQRPDQGEITFNGASIVGRPTHRIISAGIARTFQTIRLFQNLSVLENVLAGLHCRMRSGIWGALLRTPGQRREEEEAVRRALGLLDRMGLKDRAGQAAGSLSHGDRRRLELARALGSEPKLLILDEPAGGMNEAETETLIGLLGSLRDQGVSVLLIEHDMRLVMRICEKVVVLENGEKIAEGPPGEIRADSRVIEAYLGPEEAC